MTGMTVQTILSQMVLLAIKGSIVGAALGGGIAGYLHVLQNETYEGVWSAIATGALHGALMGALIGAAAISPTALALALAAAFGINFGLTLPLLMNRGIAVRTKAALILLLVAHFLIVRHAYLEAAASGAPADWVEMSGMLRDAARYNGNFGIGEATAGRANTLGKAWVGEGYTVRAGGRIWTSADGFRQYRLPSFKPRLGRFQSNFEHRTSTSGFWEGNGHLEITDL